MWVEGTIYVISALSILLVAVFVSVGKMTRVRLLYLILSVLAFIYIIAQSIVIATTWSLSLLVLRTGALAVNLLAYVALLFCLEYSGYKPSRAWRVLLALPVVAIALLNYTPLLIRSIDVTDGGFSTSTGPLYTLQTIIVVVYFLAAIGVLLRARHTAEGSQRSSLNLLVIGFSLPVAINFLTNYVFISNPSAQVLIPLSLLILSGSVGYAIARHGLFDIRLIVARLMGYTASLGVLVAVFGLIGLIIANSIFNLNAPASAEIFLLIATVLAAVSFGRVKSFFDRISNRLFYQDAYDAQAFIADINRIVISTVEIDTLLHQISHSIEHHLKVESVMFYLNSTSHATERVAGKARTKLGPDGIATLKQRLKGRANTILHVEELPVESSDYQFFRKTDIELVGLLISTTDYSRRTTLGYLVLGPKKSGGPYNSNDKKVINILVDELVLAIQNALRFEEIQNFNLTLQGKVDDATRKLRKANEKLKALDETKDDFISMASHQLRTPLTSVKGYLSMVLEGDAGKVSGQQREMLNQASLSAQRMVFLIADLLNVSRLKTGKFVIERTPINLKTMIEQEMNQLKETAVSRQLSLSFEAPQNFPNVLLDETKTRQVLMNFIDNAIYYTPAGGHIKVRLIDNPTTLEMRVEDDGIGVAKSDQPHLFTKFYRAGNARKARPDGTGLGLFMAKKVIIAEEGSLIFESEEGRGSTFGFVFSKAKVAVPGRGAGPVVANARGEALAISK